jgi:hypothetical protein
METLTGEGHTALATTGQKNIFLKTHALLILPFERTSKTRFQENPAETIID